MTAKKLKRMLKRTPANGVVMILLLIAAMCLLVYMMLHAFEQNEPLPVLLTILAVSIIMQFLIVRWIIKIIAGAIKVRKNGKKTIEYLESRGLMESAVAEYNKPDRAAFRAINRDFSMDRFTGRSNTLTENFIFALCSNQIICYEDICKVCLVSYVFAHAGTHSNVVLTLLTNDDEEIDLLSFRNGALYNKHEEVRKWICDVIKLRNPKCEINTTIPLIRKR